MSDIDKLIERLWAINCGSQGCQTTRDEAADALARMTWTPLPEEVAETIEWLNMGTTLAADGSPSLYRKTARLLESLARENARLVSNHHVQNRANAVLAKERDRLAAENAELTFRLDELSEDSASIHNERTKTRLAHQEEVERLRAELASYKAATKLVVEYDRQQDKLDAKKGGST